jgi:hypothetical protein
MAIIITLTLGLVIGFIAGALAYKNNSTKFNCKITCAEAEAKAVEEKVKATINQIKK